MIKLNISYLQVRTVYLLVVAQKGCETHLEDRVDLFALELVGTEQAKSTFYLCRSEALFSRFEQGEDICSVGRMIWRGVSLLGQRDG